MFNMFLFYRVLKLRQFFLNQYVLKDLLNNLFAHYNRLSALYHSFMQKNACYKRKIRKIKAKFIAPIVK